MTRTGSESENGLETLFRAHAGPLLRFAVVVTGDRGMAEELVQEAFVGLARQQQPPRPGSELAYLRRTVLNLSRGRHRHLAVVRRHAVSATLSAPAAEIGVERRDVQQRVADAVRRLPIRQRDCMILRCYAEATDSEIALTLGISEGSVKTHLRRARQTLSAVLEDLR